MTDKLKPMLVLWRHHDSWNDSVLCTLVKTPDLNAAIERFRDWKDIHKKSAELLGVSYIEQDFDGGGHFVSAVEEFSPAITYTTTGDLKEIIRPRKDKT